MKFKVKAPGFEQTYERWTDALAAANGLKPELKSWFKDIRIFAGEDLIWVYSKLRSHPEYIGPGTYNRLARLFIAEAQDEAVQSAQAAASWQIRQHRLAWGERTYLMGVLNVTPDSFSDGGQFNVPDAALQQARTLAQSVDILDIGGQSTRPGAEQISPEAELERVLPVIQAIRAEADEPLRSVPISVDTTRAAVARAAIAAGADIINDISGGTYEPEILKVAAECDCPIILMHIRGTPETMQQLTDYSDLMDEIAEFFVTQTERAQAAGIPRHQIALDPGIGFAKTAEQNLVILRSLSQLRPLGCPLLVGPSRKRFIGKILDQPDPQQRGWGTAAACCAAIAQGADILRIHDGAEIRDVALVADAVWRGI
ncbi:dihydropteroate synthase [Romeria aff. gracilis LEGE 07310]|uniref:Dihydropteroate synthase n=1 Tax=Vasconcelosia minhoensis LEGE 07310 TaxID=915328 RepID=A0A8J7AUT0_9CYAN|nr:dihydropteroate synthase [Romeria gracilis]MBE9077223.1 dihydropteroate synthase [Romeria aff. gracilis LEGE 07310]